jgi:divalent metal cation (Fe/Co/Zn/Cd) transporter
MDVIQVRLRQGGAYTFTDVDIAVQRNLSFSQAHDVATSVERRLQKMMPQSDVVVHVDPSTHGDETAYEKVRAVASAQGLTAHSVHVHDIRGKTYLEFHTEVPEDLNVEEAHQLVSAVEENLREEIPGLEDVITHIEPADRDRAAAPLSPEEVAHVEEAVRRVVDARCGQGNWHRLVVRDESGMLSISLHCQVPGDTSIRKEHDLSEHLETSLREAVPNVGQVVVHVEPLET